MDRRLRADVRDAGGLLQELVSNDLRVTGAGPTASAMLSPGLGTRRLGFYVSGRGSLLMNETQQRVYEMKGAFTTELEDIAEQREVLGNFELGLGLQYGQAIGRQAGIFVRAAYEVQLWLDAAGACQLPVFQANRASPGRSCTPIRAACNRR